MNIRIATEQQLKRKYNKFNSIFAELE